jgi:hypothetical protein
MSLGTILVIFPGKMREKFPGKMLEEFPGNIFVIFPGKMLNNPDVVLAVLFAIVLFCVDCEIGTVQALANTANATNPISATFRDKLSPLNYFKTVFYKPFSFYFIFNEATKPLFLISLSCETQLAVRAAVKFAILNQIFA